MSKFSVKKPLTVFMAVIAVIVLGIVSYTRMTPDLMPNMNMPYVMIMTSYPGATPEKVEISISKPMEQAMATLDGIKGVYSTSSENYSMVTLEFEEDTNMDSTTVDILQKINQIEGYWDDMVGTPYILKINPNMMPVMVAAVEIDGMSNTELSELLDKEILSKLESVNGVANINESGNVQEKISVMLSQDKIDKLYSRIYGEIDKNFAEPMEAIENGYAALQPAYDAFEKSISDIKSNAEMTEEMKNAAINQITASAEYTQVMDGWKQLQDSEAQLKDSMEQAHSAVDLSQLLSMDTLSGILTAQDFSMPAGYVTQDGVKCLVSVGDEIKSIEEIQNLVLVDLGMEGIEPVKVSDVADVFMMNNSAEIYAKINGNDGVVLSFSKQSSYATADVADNISEKFDELSDEYEGLNFTVLMSQGDYIDIIINSITSSLLWGALFAVIILFVFLKDIRPTFITLCSIPVSVIFAVVLMYFSGISLNMMSLSGLAIAVGMLVDNSVVVIENIYRLKSKGESAVKAAVSGAVQVGGAITSSTLTTICVFLPIVFVDGLSRELFTDMALTLGYALVASLIIALTLVPALASGLLKKAQPKEDKFFKKFNSGYKKAVTWSLSHKPVVLILAVALLAGSCFAAIRKGFVFMPDMDMPQLTATLEMEQGSTLEETKDVSNQAVSRICDVEGVVTVGAMTGGNNMMGMGEASDTLVSFYIILDEDTDREFSDIADEINEKCSDLDCEFEVTNAMDLSAYMGGSGLSIQIFGNNLDDLQNTAKDVADIIGGVEGTLNVSNGLEENDPALRITVDKEKAMLKSLTVAQVFSDISANLTTEKTAVDITDANGTYDVVVSSDSSEELTPDFIRNYKLTVTGKDGSTSEVALSDIAEINETETLSSISRENQKRYITVTSEVDDDHNVTLVTKDAKDALKDYEVPNGITIEFGGENESIADSMSDMILMMLLGIILVYMIMVAQFQSLKSPFIVMFTIPLAFTGGLLGLLIAGLEISVISMLGFVMLCGIIVNNGIVLVDYINQLRIDGVEKKKAIVEAGATRMRPILMTSITTVLGLIVMALGQDSGSAMMQPIAIVCIGGLVYATALTLFVIPCLYDMMNKKEMKKIDEKDLEISSK